MRKKLTTSIKRKITKAWEEEFPNLVIYKNMRLLRRVGMILQGICLDRDSSNDNYLPIFHIHNLVLQESDFISLTLCHPLVTRKHGVPSHVTFVKHEEQFQSIVNEFRSQIPFPLEGDLKCDDILSAFDDYIKNGKAETQYPLNPYRDIFCLLVWCNRIDEAKSFFDKAYENIQTWPERVTKYAEDRIEDFIAKKVYLEKPELIRKRVDEVVRELKIEHLPNSNII